MSISLISLRIDSLDDTAGVSAVNMSPDGASHVERFDLPLPSDVQREISKWRDPRTRTSPLAVGKGLYAHIFRGDVGRKLESALKRSQGSDVAYVGISSSQPNVQSLPLEIAHDGKSYLQGGNRLVFRQIDDGVRIEPRIGEVKRVLVALAEPKLPEYKWGRDEFTKEIEEFLKGWGVEYQVLSHVTPTQLRQHLFQEKGAKREYDVILIVAHGKPGETDADGSLILEDDKGGVAPYAASALATTLSGHTGCTLVLISCSSASSVEENALASVAHRAIVDGRVGAVVAMQRLVRVNTGLDISRSLLTSLRNHANIFTAFRDSLPQTPDAEEHGTACLFARVPGEIIARAVYEGEDGDEKDNLRRLFSIPRPAKCDVAISLAAFCMGVQPSEFDNYKAKLFELLGDAYKYPGRTFARGDVRCVQHIIALLGKLIPTDRVPEHISIITDDQLEEAIQGTKYSTILLVGSRSHSQVRPTLQQYSEGFALEYDNVGWTIVDKVSEKKYRRSDPSKSPSAKEETGDDFAIIEKVVLKNGRAIFFIAGLWDRSTLAAGQYLLEKRHFLVQEFGDSGFQILLKIAVGSTNVREVIVQRSPTPKNGAVA